MSLLSATDASLKTVKPPLMEQGTLPIPRIDDSGNSTITSVADPDNITSIIQDSKIQYAPVQLETLQISDEATIPLIDLEAIDIAKGNEREILIKRLGDGLRDVGFVAVKAESLMPLIGKVNKEMEDFFHQPREVKMNDWKNDNGETGFSPEGLETAAGAKYADIKETYFVPPNFTGWPEGRNEFEEVMKKYHAELTKLASRIMVFLTEYFGEPIENVEKSMKCAYNLLRLAFYRALKQTDNPRAVWAFMHTDLNWITLLPPSRVPGLQLMTKKGEWLPVRVPDGYIIVNTGDQLEYKTAGLIKATPHQVINPGGKYARAERFASIFFASLSSEFSLSPFKKCVDKMTEGMSEREIMEFLKKFPDITVQENLDSRLIEMGAYKNPTREVVVNLLSKGLLKQPTEALKSAYPDLF